MPMKRRLRNPSIAMALVLGLFVAFHIIEFTIMPVDFNPIRAWVFYPVWVVLLIAVIVWGGRSGLES